MVKLDAPLRAQFPARYRLWLWWLAVAPRRKNGGAWGGSAVFRSLRSVTGRFPVDPENLITLGDPSAPYKIVVDVLDFECFNHTVPLWLSGSDEQQLLLRLVRPGDVFVDVGANHGIYALTAATAVGRQATVLAFEPQPRLAEALRRSARINSLTNLRVFECMLGDRTTDVQFFVPRSGSGVASASAAHAAQTGIADAMTRECRRLDNVFEAEGIQRLDLMKVDVEGFEHDVFVGAENVLRRFQPIVWFEYNPIALESGPGLGRSGLEALSAVGYSRFFELPAMTRVTLPKGPALRNIVAVPDRHSMYFAEMYPHCG